MNDDFLIDLPDIDDPSLPPALSTQSMITPFASFDGFQPINKWDPRLLMDLAIGVEDLPSILARYDLTEKGLNSLLDHPVFRRELAVMTRDVQENGATFRAKAKIQAESYLPVLDHIVNDESVPTGIRLDAIKSAVRWGDLEPREVKGQENNAAQVNIQINF
jgi:hypothetical protein